jgi:hypothetical protein
MAYVWDFCLQVKAWMADKEAEALRNQQELVKEEEAAQMKWVLGSKTHLTQQWSFFLVLCQIHPCFRVLGARCQLFFSFLP